MAKKYKASKEKKIKNLLSQQQIKQVDNTGDYIDDQIDIQTNITDTTARVVIEYCKMTFHCDEDGNPLSYPENERSLMQTLLFDRFTDVGWKIMTDDQKDNWILYTRNVTLSIR